MAAAVAPMTNSAKVEGSGIGVPTVTCPLAGRPASPLTTRDRMLVLPTNPKKLEVDATLLVVVMKLRSANEAVRMMLPKARFPSVSRLKNVPPTAVALGLKLVKTRPKPS